MRITLAYNLRRESSEEEAELLTDEDVERLTGALSSLGHAVTPVEVSGPPDQVVDRLLASRPELVFNVAEGLSGRAREARYPAIYEQLGLAHTGGGTSLLYVDLDKRLSERIMQARGVRVPHGALLTRDGPELPDDLTYPVIVKPNYEGSSKGITADAVVDSAEEARERAEALLDDFPQGVAIEEFITGRELAVPMLEAWPGALLDIVETEIRDGDDRRYRFLDYERKQQAEDRLRAVCPPELPAEARQDVLTLADRAFAVMPCPDFGRADIRLRDDGTPFLLEINPLPALQPEATLPTAARARGIEYEEMIGLVVRSAARRHGLPLRRTMYAIPTPQASERPTARALGITVGRHPTGEHNAITDVEGVCVGHVTHSDDDVPVPGEDGETTCVRTGVTAVVPRGDSLFHDHLVTGGFVLNGIGEMSGLTQAMEWGWLETPILLTNTMSVGLIHAGIIHHMIDRHPELGRAVDVIIPIVGETNDAFLNDVRVLSNTPRDAMAAIDAARDGPVEQGSVGGGTGMVSFDFAGGIGTSSRVVTHDGMRYTVGVLVQSNFGNMRELTVDGHVVGRELDPLFPYEGRRGRDYGSVIVVLATDAPLLSAQLNRVAKRAALGLGRVGSHAAATSGEFVFAFSTGNRTSRQAKGQARTLNLTFVTDEHIDPIYEAAVEATEEAVLNAVFCSGGQVGREGRVAPAIPTDAVRAILTRGRVDAAGDEPGGEVARP